MTQMKASAHRIRAVLDQKYVLVIFSLSVVVEKPNPVTVLLIQHRQLQARHLHVAHCMIYPWRNTHCRYGMRESTDHPSNRNFCNIQHNRPCRNHLQHTQMQAAAYQVPLGAGKSLSLRYDHGSNAVSIPRHSTRIR